MFRLLFALLLQSAFSGLALATIHHLFVGNLALPASIHALEFDDDALTLVKTRTIPADSSHAWIAFDVPYPLSFIPLKRSNTNDSTRS